MDDISISLSQLAYILLRRKFTWIPVSEQLPQSNTRVLIFCPLLEPHEVIGATIYPGSTWSVWITDDGQELGKTEPTHWMPILGPPEVTT